MLVRLIRKGVLMSQERSPELRALEAKYAELQERQPVRTTEPENTGRSIEAFVDLSTKVAEEYTPSQYLRSAPLK